MTEERWRRRPLLSALVRFLTVATPIAASVATAVVMSRLMPVPSGTMGLAGWWGAILLASTVALLAVDRLARRLLPLAVLLNLSMVFPDKAPDRFWTAFRAGTIRHLEERLAQARRTGLRDEPAEAAHTIIELISAITVHDRRTRGHSERVRAFNDLIAEELHLSEADRDRLRWAALLHDVGKLDTSPRVLNKPGPPTADEWRELHRHPEVGARLTAPLHAWLGPWAAAIGEHHERWDGEGYPAGLSGPEISLGARIVAVADAYEVMTSPRPYRRAMTPRAAREELARSAAGSQFDPMVVRAFLTVSLGKLRRVVGPISWLLQFPFLVTMPRIEVAAATLGRQLVVGAGTASAVGVIGVLGVFQPPPPSTPPPTQSWSSSVQRAVETGSARLLGQEPATQASSRPGSPVVSPGPGGSGPGRPVEVPPGQGVGSDKRGGPSERLPADARGRLPGVDRPLPNLPPLPTLPPVTLPEVREPLLPVQPPRVAPLDEILPGGRPQR